ncbi:polysaccharide biosynthesis/export family protein [Flavobacterium capsici]|uniref:Polysaccharide biosynthesis/export family protein n=1 Tax=Flavobacterium capsici TaxID=3075618 RepID=A0AA96F2T3_9FLAO|nr:MULTISPECIES: polysaccharide biosynthesis/export family protein [unclassified Flavobacterium]WNM20240.1 polysaccharide biosynthesis/export family protein [Flavobacterium sp. PMR2A8]WNM21630.1 polysaccharide biosynthesis/export family protein [Flavobacterium sp. PMTSA4]
MKVLQLKNLKNSVFLLIILFFASCANKKDILYYQDIKLNGNDYINYLSSTIQINDILFIKVSALIPESAEPFNIQAYSSNGNINMESYRIQGYLVSQEGNIVFPILGTINLAGKSTTEAQVLIAKMLNDGGFIKEPTVSVRVINSKVTVLGEVKAPGTYNYDEQNLTLNQAIGLAGDLTINGVRKEVLVIREVNGIRTYVNIDLTSSDWFTSPYYYVKQNDIIIVKPNGPKIMTSGYLNSIGTTLGIVSFALTLYLLLK